MSISTQALNRNINSNTGSSLSATSALHLPGWSTLPINDWKNRESIDTSKHIRLVRLTFVHYVHKSLVATTAFLLDFGMIIAKQTPNKIWFRGYSNDSYCYIAEEGKEIKFLGGGYTVESYADLERQDYPMYNFTFIASTYTSDTEQRHKFLEQAASSDLLNRLVVDFAFALLTRKDFPRHLYTAPAPFPLRLSSLCH